MLFAPVIRRAAPQTAHRTVDQSLERFLQSAACAAHPQATAQSGITAYTVDQDETTYTLNLDIPGLAREHISIGIEGAVVRIDSLADAPRKLKAVFELPQDIDTTTSTAKLENGVLTLKLGKLVPVSKITALAIN